MQGSPLVNTKRSQKWLRNFNSSEADAAMLLLSGIRIATSTEMRMALLQLFSAIESEDRIDFPAVLYPAMSMGDILKSPPPGSKHVAFVTFNPGGGISTTPGSEGWAGNLMRDLLTNANDKQNPKWLAPQSTLTELRAAKVRSVVVVTDYCGSGNQVVEYVNSFFRNKTIRSWHSFGWIKVYIVAFAISPEARRIFESDPKIEKCFFVETANTFGNAGWSDSQTKNVASLCMKHAIRRLRSEALGYRESCGLFVMDTGVPNNVPAILRQRRPGWHPLFDKKKMPPSLLDDVLTAAASEWGQRIRNRDSDSGNGQRGREFKRGSILKIEDVLRIISLQIRETERIADFTGLTIKTVEEIVSDLKSLGLIDSEKTLTKLGMAEILRLNRKVTTSQVVPTARVDPYYPSTLR